MQMFGSPGIYCMVVLGIGQEANCWTAELLCSMLSFLSLSLPVLPLQLVDSCGISSGLSVLFTLDTFNNILLYLI